MSAARLALAALLLALGACRAAPPGPEPESSFEPLPDLEFSDQTGRRVRFVRDLAAGHTLALQFFFSDCRGVCPLATARLLALQDALGERLGRDVRFVSITLDPEHDTPAVLAQHAATIGARPGWTFLTGAREDIERLRRRLGVFDLDPLLDADRDQHAGVLVLGNEPARRWIMKPANVPAAALERALRLLADGPRAPAEPRASSGATERP